jgi:hypothetical protein
LLWSPEIKESKSGIDDERWKAVISGSIFYPGSERSRRILEEINPSVES